MDHDNAGKNRLAFVVACGPKNRGSHVKKILLVPIFQNTG
jgi:hypothetical protein